MKKLLLIPAIAVMFAGCAGQTTRVSKISDDPIVQREMDRETKQAQKCFRGMKSLSHEGRTKFVNCVAPTAARKRAARLCIQFQVQEQGIPLTTGRSKRFAKGVAHCVVVTK